MKKLALLLSTIVVFVDPAAMVLTAPPAPTPGAIVQASLNAAVSRSADVFTFPDGDVTFGPKERLECTRCKHMRLVGGVGTTLWFQPGTGC